MPARFARTRTFRSSLLLMVVAASAVAAALVAVLLVTSEHLRLRVLVGDNLTFHAEVIALHAASTITFESPEVAEETLSALRAIDGMAAAAIFRREGPEFARFERRPGEPRPVRLALGEPGQRWHGAWVVHQEPIRGTEGEHLGTMVIAYDATWVNRRLLANSGAALLLALLSMSIAVLVARRLQQRLEAPMNELLLTARAVSHSGNFSLRARKLEEDELGQFTDVFNEMLRRIEDQTEEISIANERFRLAVEAAPNAMVMVDERGVILLVNARTEELFGWSRDELMGKEIEVLVPDRFRRAHPSHRSSFFRTPEARPMGAGRELFGLRKDGSEFPVEIGLSPVRTDEGLRVLSSIVDISARRMAEAALRESEARKAAILESALDCLISMDHEGRIIDFNPASERTFGYSKEEAVGRTVAELIIPPHLREGHGKGLRRFLVSGETTVIGKRLEMQALRADGSEFPVELAIAAVELAGSPPFFTAYLRDITERKRAEEERARLLDSERTARSEAEHASRMKDEFVATLSHELRTPLTAIGGWAQMLRRKDVSKQDPDLDQGLEIIERNARVQTQIIEDLLDMSRIISGKIRLDVQLVELPEVIAAAISTVQPAADGKSIRLQKVIDPRVGPVHGDPDRLQQIVWNLLSNAIKFTPKGGRVQIALQRINSHIEINVSDTGEGIDETFLPHLFERFRQADASTTRRHGGLGLGLAIVKQLVELHGGGVHASSAGVGKGSTFTVTLPLAIMHPRETIEERRHPSRGLVTSAHSEATTSLRGVKVLVVEDDPDARMLISRLLADTDADVTTSESALEALELLAQVRPDVMVSDIGMPEIDGYELIRRVRHLPAAEGGDVPAVALTAFARSEDRTRALLAGYQMHVAKPVEPSELIASVASLVGIPGWRSRIRSGPTDGEPETDHEPRTV